MRPRRRPALLDGLTLTETSVCRKGANEHAAILFWKRHGTPPPPPAPLAERLAKLEADLAATRANRRAGEALEALAKGDTAVAGELLGDADTYSAYSARLWGEEWRPPVAKAAGPDRRAEIRKAVAEANFAELDRLVRQPDGGRQYHELLMAGDLAEPAAEGIAKRGRTPAQVPVAEVARWRERIRAMLKARDQKGMTRPGARAGPPSRPPGSRWRRPARG